MLKEERLDPASALNFIPIATPQLKAMVAKYATTLSSAQFDGLIADLRVMFEKYSTHLAKFTPGVERAQAAHRLITPPITQNTQVAATCARGCGACCHLEVEITRDEGELLATIVAGGFAIDRERLAKQAARERKSPEWNKMVDPSNRCVFLGDDQACQVYEYRPSICRKHIVASDPTECMKPGGNPLPILIPLAEVVLSATLSQPDNPYRSISKSVSEALAKLETTQ